MFDWHCFITGLLTRDAHKSFAADNYIEFPIEFKFLECESSAGSGCTKQVKIKWDFLQLRSQRSFYTLLLRINQPKDD